MMYVYHAVYNNHKLQELGISLMRPTVRGAEQLIADGCLTYKLVAHVGNTTELDKAYEQTNTIDHDWWLNRNVMPAFHARGCRSTSVGDVIVDNDNKAWLVDNIGFLEFNIELLPKVPGNGE